MLHIRHFCFYYTYVTPDMLLFRFTSISKLSSNVNVGWIVQPVSKANKKLSKNSADSHVMGSKYALLSYLITLLHALDNQKTNLTVPANTKTHSRDWDFFKDNYFQNFEKFLTHLCLSNFKKLKVSSRKISFFNGDLPAFWAFSSFI